ncbi:MAG: hypothetical protein PUB08_01435 [Firmicutes bacterium]|nr:hypothetical protein [Bacillota bacterium]
MTQKELNYVEDALGHEKEMQTICTDLASQISDSDLKSFVQTLANEHTDSFSKFYSLINK